MNFFRCCIGLFAVTCSFLSPAQSDEVFIANLTASQVVGNTTTETGFGTATFVLDTAQLNLSYSIQLFGLDLKPNAADRTGFSDVDKIHLHNAFAGNTGPHVLNIFGLPSEDDDEMVVDFENESITGVYNDDDAFDSNGQLFDQNSPGTTKLFSNFVDDLLGEQLYIAVHTAGQNGDVAIRGQIRAVPEPSGGVLAGLSLAAFYLRRRK